MTNTLTARNATLADLATILSDHHARKLDVVASAGAITSEGGVLRIAGTEPILTDDGVTSADGFYRPTAVCDEGIADKLGVPVAYLKRLRTERPDIFDANVNGWLHGTDDGAGAMADARSFLLRCLRPDDDGREGVARAFLSDSYRVIDNLDVLTAALEGVRSAGVNVDVQGCDLTERRMYVRFVAPEVQALAPTLLRGYKSPFSGNTGADNPTVFAGFVLSNSETGGGAFTIVPRLVVQVCTNGMTITRDAMREVHLGGKLDEGVVRWSEATQAKTLELVTSRAADAVRTFLDVDYMTMVLDRLELASAKPLANPADAVRNVGQALRFSQDRIAGILDHFIKGGDATVGGVLHAVTSFAQTLPDADDAMELEGMAMRAFDLAGALA